MKWLHNNAYFIALQLKVIHHVVSRRAGITSASYMGHTVKRTCNVCRQTKSKQSHPSKRTPYIIKQPLKWQRSTRVLKPNVGGDDKATPVSQNEAVTKRVEYVRRLASHIYLVVRQRKQSADGVWRMVHRRGRLIVVECGGEGVHLISSNSF